MLQRTGQFEIARREKKKPQEKIVTIVTTTITNTTITTTTITTTTITTTITSTTTTTTIIPITSTTTNIITTSIAYYYCYCQALLSHCMPTTTAMLLA